eukprot:CAMPEP_0119287276 /NCGR_PEP_ID=MMETSP1329-20130426/35296_1 /TAXON_ID=114041 /ORGANISM="Genus nov. species nov., Strain RCC1024" /LENGTH=127 /DNA_ID=CAMNT_0007288033 /DNA_START=145 /DNA_END=525 /DNA_ORIENTATION=+
MSALDYSRFDRIDDSDEEKTDFWREPAVANALGQRGFALVNTDDAPVAAEAVRAVEILPGGSESQEVGGEVVEASLPPLATAVAPEDAPEDAANVVVCENVNLPAGGLVELQYGLKVPLEVVEATAE